VGCGGCKGRHLPGTFDWMGVKRVSGKSSGETPCKGPGKGGRDQCKEIEKCRGARQGKVGSSLSWWDADSKASLSTHRRRREVCETVLLRRYHELQTHFQRFLSSNWKFLYCLC
jgi:hypothetical protein